MNHIETIVAMWLQPRSSLPHLYVPCDMKQLIIKWLYSKKIGLFLTHFLEIEKKKVIWLLQVCNLFPPLAENLRGSHESTSASVQT